MFFSSYMKTDIVFEDSTKRCDKKMLTIQNFLTNKKKKILY